MADLPELDPIVHGKLRLAILSLLSTAEAAEFVWLRDRTGATDGNLGAQLLKLEESGYIACEKKFILRKPVSWYRITAQGKKALLDYVRAMRTLLNLGDAADADASEA